jgi:hypothetical protein
MDSKSCLTDHLHIPQPPPCYIWSFRWWWMRIVESAWVVLEDRARVRARLSRFLIEDRGSVRMVKYYYIWYKSIQDFVFWNSYKIKDIFLLKYAYPRMILGGIPWWTLNYEITNWKMLLLNMRISSPACFVYQKLISETETCSFITAAQVYPLQNSAIPNQTPWPQQELKLLNLTNIGIQLEVEIACHPNSTALFHCKV